MFFARVLCIFLMIVASTPAAFSQEAISDQYSTWESSELTHLVGLGATRCDRFIQLVSGDDAAHLNFQAWGHGYLSGMNFERQKEGLATVNFFGDKYEFLHVVQWCAENPRKFFHESVSELFRAHMWLQGLDRP